MLSEKKAVNALKPWWDVAFQVTITALIVLGKKKLNLTYYCVKLKIFDKLLDICRHLHFLYEKKNPLV